MERKTSLKKVPLKKKRPLAGTLSTSRPKKRVQGKNKPSRPKQKTISKLKKEIEVLQKRIVLKLYGNDCYTCPAKDLQGSNCHLGHVPWPRTDLSVAAKLDYRYTRSQCYRCNIHLSGAGATAYARMLFEGVDMLFLRENGNEGKGRPLPRTWYEDKMAEYNAFLLSPTLEENEQKDPTPEV